jgi:hypothetical protein
MGSSYVRYRDLGFWARDGQLDTWLALLGTAALGWSPPSEWLNELANDWLEQARLSLSGCISCSLDEYLVSEDRRVVVLTLAEACVDRLSAGGVLPAGWLNSVTLSGTDDWRESLPCDLYLSIGAAFVALLNSDAELLEVAAERVLSPNDIYLPRRLTSR